MFEPNSEIVVATTSWPEFQAELRDTLLDLGLKSMLHVRVRDWARPAAAEPAAAHGHFAKLHSLFGGEERDAEPALSFFRMDETLYCACTGPVEDGGWVRYSTEQKLQITDLGWEQATGNGREMWGFPDYCLYFPHEGETLSRPRRVFSPGCYRDRVDADWAARLAVDTLQGPLGAATPEGLRVDRNGH
jgi:hypothetical protein